MIIQMICRDEECSPHLNSKPLFPNFSGMRLLLSLEMCQRCNMPVDGAFQKFDTSPSETAKIEAFVFACNSAKSM
jgi:hypothetical protein